MLDRMSSRDAGFGCAQNCIWLHHMKKQARILAVIGILAALAIAWQISAACLENYGFSSDLKDLAVQNSARIGLKPFQTEDELKSAVITSAHEHGIQLALDHLTVHRNLTPGTVAENGMPEKPSVLDISIATNYDAPVGFPGLSFNIHFSPAASYSAPIIVK